MPPKKNYNQMYKEEKDVRPKDEMETSVYEKVEKTAEEPVKEVPKPKKPKKKFGVVVGGNLNVREIPNGKIIGNLPSGETIEILEEEDGWYKIDNGYVMAKFVEVR